MGHSGNPTAFLGSGSRQKRGCGSRHLQVGGGRPGRGAGTSGISSRPTPFFTWLPGDHTLPRSSPHPQPLQGEHSEGPGPFTRTCSQTARLPRAPPQPSRSSPARRWTSRWAAALTGRPPPGRPDHSQVCLALNFPSARAGCETAKVQPLQRRDQPGSTSVPIEAT